MPTAPAARYPMQYSLSLAPSEDSGVVKGWTPGTSTDLSRTGLGIELQGKVQLSPGSEVLVNLVSDDGKVKVLIRAEVVWKRGRRLGVQIIELERPARAFYESLVRGYAWLQDLSA